MCYCDVVDLVRWMPFNRQRFICISNQNSRLLLSTMKPWWLNTFQQVLWWEAQPPHSINQNLTWTQYDSIYQTCFSSNNNPIKWTNTVIIQQGSREVCESLLPYRNKTGSSRWSRILSPSSQISPVKPQREREREIINWLTSQLQGGLKLQQGKEKKKSKTQQTLWGMCWWVMIITALNFDE